MAHLAGLAMETEMGWGGTETRERRRDGDGLAVWDEREGDERCTDAGSVRTGPH
jgi:hypothetical protein